MNLDSKLTVPPQVISRLVGDETVLLDLESGLYFGLDNVGQYIWEAVSAGKNLGEASDAVVSEYSVDKVQAEADVIEFASTLVARGLLAE